MKRPWPPLKNSQSPTEGLAVRVPSQRVKRLGREPLADGGDNEGPEGEDWSPMQPSHLPQNLCLPAWKAGVDTMTIKDLGRWESISMVERYTRSVRFDDSLKLYQSIVN